MKSFFFALFVALATAQMVLSSPMVTSPVASTTGHGGKKLKVSWKDNGQSPKLNKKDFGNIDVYLAAGSQNTQYKLQKLASNVKPKSHTGHYNISKNIGPSGEYYFIRLEGSQKDSKGYPVMAFSARFKLEGMSGKFNNTVLAAAKGQEGPASSASSSGSSAASSSATGNVLSAFSSPSGSASASSNAAAATGTSLAATSGAGRLERGLTIIGGGALAVAGVVALV